MAQTCTTYIFEMTLWMLYMLVMVASYGVLIAERYTLCQYVYAPDDITSVCDPVYSLQLFII